MGPPRSWIQGQTGSAKGIETTAALGTPQNLIAKGQQVNNHLLPACVSGPPIGSPFLDRAPSGQSTKETLKLNPKTRLSLRPKLRLDTKQPYPMGFK
jgi:hypothetical protein